VLEHFYQAGLIQWRISIRRAHDRGDATFDGGSKLSLERAAVFVARLAQANGKVSQARAHDQTARVNAFVGRESDRRPANACYFSGGYKYICHFICARRWVNQPTALDVYFH
jgi:hypothetical protein